MQNHERAGLGQYTAMNTVGQEVTLSEIELD